MAGPSPSGWRGVELREIMVESDARAADRVDLPLLSVTKHDGAVLAKERFSRVLAGKDLSRYRVARRESVVIDPMLLWDGVIALQHRFAEGLVSPDYRVFELSDGVDPSFFDYLAHEPGMRRQYAAAARGTNVRRRRISRDDFLAITTTVPPLVEQRRIAATLQAVDDAIAADEAVVEQLERVRRYQAEDLLTRGLVQHRHEVKHSAIGTIPSSWTVRALSDVALVQTGLAKGKAPAGAVLDLPYLRVANVQDGYVDLEEVKTVSVEPGALDRYRLRAGDVLFTEGGNFDQLGRGCVWRGQINPCLHQNHVFAVRTGTDLLPEFLAAHAASGRGRSYFLGCAKRTTNLASINSTQLKALPVPIPPLTEQQAIVNALGAVAARLDAERAVVAERRRIKAALATALLTGQIRVPAQDPA